MTMPRPLRWFWRVYIPIAVAAVVTVLGAPFGAMVEGRVWPIRVDQRMEEIVRTADRLCWTWVSRKTRNAVSDNMDVFLSTRTDRMVVAVFERDTGLPWGRSRAVGIGLHRQPYCVLLPPNVTSTDAIRVEQMAYYPGLLGLWHVVVRFPDILDPPGSTVP